MMAGTLTQRIRGSPRKIPSTMSGFCAIYTCVRMQVLAVESRFRCLGTRKPIHFVNNESADIIRMMAVDFTLRQNGQGTAYPARIRLDVDAAMERFYQPINNGVYRCGFAGSPSAYAQARCLVCCFGRREHVLTGQPFVCGNELTIADIALFTTLIRFDPSTMCTSKPEKHVYEYPQLIL